MSDLNDSISRNAERVLAAIGSAPLSGKPAGLTAWDLKLELKISNSALYLALGWLVRAGKLSLEPRDFTYLVSPKPQASPNPETPEPPAPIPSPIPIES